jgi:hypothetical protein
MIEYMTIRNMSRPFAGPEQVLAYLARYTHRVRDRQQLARLDR